MSFDARLTMSFDAQLPMYNFFIIIILTKTQKLGRIDRG